MKEIDFSKFKKISQDKKAALLKHPDGHEIKIAISGLSPSMRKKLEALPLHAAGGVDVIPTPEPQATPDYEPEAAEQAPEPAGQTASAPSGEPYAQMPEQPSVQTPMEPSAQTPEGLDMEEDDTPETPDSSAKQPVAQVGAPKKAQAQAPTPQPAPQAAPVALPPPPGPPTKQDFDQQDAAFARELLHKEIKPETLSDLFGKKDTLGKIGTFFGLLVSGAGSGLTHQPNALLEMMNKEIDRDLEVQKQNKTNAQNFLTLTYQHELNEAQKQRFSYENALMQAQTGAIPTDMAYKQAQTAMLPAQTRLMLAQAEGLEAENAGLAGLTRTKNNMLQTMYSHLQDQTAGSPQAQATLQNVVGPAVQQEMQKNNQEAAAKIQINTQRKQQQEADQSPVDIDKMNRLISLGRIDPSMPGAIPPADVPAITHEANEIKISRNLTQQYVDSFRRLNSSVAGGRINKNLREAEVESLAARIAKESGVMSTEQAKKQVNGMFPEWDDWGQAREEKFRKGLEHFRGKEADSITLDRYGLKTPFPNYSLDGQKKPELVQQKGIPAVGAPTERSAANGKTALFDPVSKKFKGYKEDTSGVAARGK